MPTVLQAIAESNTLSGLLERMALSKVCLDIVLKRLPLGLHTSIAAGPLANGEWCILISNASAVVKLKQFKPMMLAAIQAQGIDVQSIRVKPNYH